MEYFLTITSKQSVIMALNRCRLYMQVITISDIASACGSFLIAGVKQGRLPHRKSSLRWPEQQHPSSSDWSLWSYHLSLLEAGLKLRQPLSSWQKPSHQTWTTFIHLEMKSIYKQENVKWLEAQYNSNRYSTRTLTYHKDAFTKIQMTCTGHPSSSNLVQTLLLYSTEEKYHHQNSSHRHQYFIISYYPIQSEILILRL